MKSSALQRAYARMLPEKPSEPPEEEHLGHFCESCGGEMSVHAEEPAEEASPLDEDAKSALFAKALKEKNP